jgi:predicted secreted protein with PEFG-CTERM motif|tara:strand:+ start:1677 stop:2513 length:837 start_codon:yes stop_codon:yes gene_type:complete
MNVQSIVLLLAIVSVGGMGITSQAFADHHSDIGGIGIIFQTDSDTYDHNSVISIDGTVNTVKSVDVTIVVSNEFGVVAIDQVPVSSDGTWSTTVSTAGPTMKYDGEYKIKATYGSGSLIHVEYVNLVGGIESGSVSGHVEHEEHHEEVVYDLASEVDYSISGGSVESITANVNGNSVVVSIQNADDGGELTITLPSDVVTPFNDGTFFVLVNDEESDDASQDGNTVTVPFEADASTIEIIGTFVVPEFGTIAAIILAVAITSIIVLSAKTKLSIIPKL